MGRRSLPLLAALALVVAACGTVPGTTYRHRIGSAPYVTGSGKTATITRQLGDFHAVSAESGIEVMVTSGTEASAAVTADDNLTGMITTNVADGTLVVTVHGSLETHNTLRVAVTAPAKLDGLSAESGATLDAETVSTEQLTAKADAGATLRAGGHATVLTLTAGAGATADLRNLETRTATASVSSGATAYVRALSSVAGSCDTGATLHVLGSPGSRSVSVTGGATVKYE